MINDELKMNPENNHKAKDGEDDEAVLKQYCADLDKRGIKYQVTPVHRKELSKN